MRKLKGIVSFCLIMAIVVCSCYITVFAESRPANIVGSNVNIRKEPNTSSDVVAKISNESVVVNGETEGESVTVGGSTSTKWYNVTYGDKSGYVSSFYVSFPPSKDDYKYDEDFEKNLLNFPESYRDALRALRSRYPNWKFKAVKHDLTFDQAVDAQYGSRYKENKKWVHLTYGVNEWRDMRAYDTTTEMWNYADKTSANNYEDCRYSYASRGAIAYFMDPRVSLNENDIFVFMYQAYDKESQTKDILRMVVSGTFLAAGYDYDGDDIVDEDAYLDDIMYAAEQSGVSPYVIASNIMIEQGKGNSGLISGNYEGYEGYYNFFNVGASDTDPRGPIVTGLEYAKGKEWNSRRAAIAGGSNFYTEGYLNIGQNTFYYMDFNIINQIWWHQYATALYDAYNKGRKLSTALIENKDAALEFHIPVFTDIPNTITAKPTTIEVPATPPTETPAPTPPPEKVIPKGDINGDDAINAIDLAAVKMHILGVKTVTGDASVAADVNGDDAINAIDLAAIKMHILGVKKIVN